MPRQLLWLSAGLLLITHFTLLLGMAAPLWLSNALQPSDQGVWPAGLAGIIILGVGGWSQCCALSCTNSSTSPASRSGRCGCICCGSAGRAAPCLPRVQEDGGGDRCCCIRDTGSMVGAVWTECWAQSCATGCLGRSWERGAGQQHWGPVGLAGRSHAAFLFVGGSDDATGQPPCALSLLCDGLPAVTSGRTGAWRKLPWILVLLQTGDLQQPHSFGGMMRASGPGVRGA